MARRNLISVKEAAEVLGLDERSVRERLINGQLKGEKRSVGLREKWFVHAASVEVSAGKHQVFDATPDDDIPIDAETVDAENAAPPPANAWLDEERRRVKMLAEEMIQPLLHTIREQERALQDKDRQLRLLPDLQKQAEQERKAAEVRALEVEALKKQIAALEEQRLELEAKAGQASELATSLQALSHRVEELQKPWWKRLFNTGNY